MRAERSRERRGAPPPRTKWTRRVLHPVRLVREGGTRRVQLVREGGWGGGGSHQPRSPASVGRAGFPAGMSDWGSAPLAIT